MKLRHLFAALLALVAILWFQGARADALDDLKAEGVVKLYHDYRAGHMLDLSGNGNDGVPTNVDWQGGGVRFNQATSVITVADSPELQLTEGTLIALGDFRDPRTDNRRFISKRDAGGTNYDWYNHTTPALMFWDGAAERNIAGSITGDHYLAVNFTSGGTPAGYADGLLAGNYSNTVTVTANDADLIIGNYFGGNFPLDSTLHAVLIINRPLTATEHAQLCAALQSYRYPTMPSARAQGSYGVEVVSNGDFEGGVTTGWSVGSAATLTAEAGHAMAGNYVLRVAHNGTADPYAFQVNLTPGTRYRINGWARGDATYLPYLQDAATLIWTGTLAATWQRFDFVFDAVGTDLRMYSNAAAAGWSEFDNITIVPVESDYIQFKTEWGVTASNTNITGGNIEGTPIWVESGTWKVTTDTVQGQTSKVLENVVAGIAYIDTSEIAGSPTADAYGTWEWWMYKGAGGNASGALFVADVEGNRTATGQDCYVLWIDNTEDVLLGEFTNGGFTSWHFATTTSYIANSTWYQFRVTRSDAGVTTTYIKGGAYSDWTTIAADSGANPFTDTTITSSLYINFDLDAGDKFSLSGPTGDQCFWKAQGVIAP